MLNRVAPCHRFAMTRKTMQDICRGPEQLQNFALEFFSLIELTNLADELVKSLRIELSPPLADPSSAGLHLGESADLD